MAIGQVPTDKGTQSSFEKPAAQVNLCDAIF
jgi:hypothetical protein